MSVGNNNVITAFDAFKERINMQLEKIQFDILLMIHHMQRHHKVHPTQTECLSIRIFVRYLEIVKEHLKDKKFTPFRNYFEELTPEEDAELRESGN